MKFLIHRTSALSYFNSSFKAKTYDGVPKENVLKLHTDHMFPFYKPYYK